MLSGQHRESTHGSGDLGPVTWDDGNRDDSLWPDGAFPGSHWLGKPDQCARDDPDAAALIRLRALRTAVALARYPPKNRPLPASLSTGPAPLHHLSPPLQHPRQHPLRASAPPL